MLTSDPDRGLAIAIQEYGPLCKTILYRILGRRSDVIEECLSDVFFRLWKNASALCADKGSLKAWLSRVSRNMAISWLRRNNIAFSPLEENDIDSGINMENEFLAKERRETLQRAVDGLPEPEKTIFVQRYYYMQKVKAIAQMLGVTEKSIEHRLIRGKEKLKFELGRMGVTQ